MREGGTRSRLGSAVVLGLSGILAALGFLSVYRQSESARVEVGFWVVDSQGTISVRHGEAAEQAGLRTGDRLLALAGSPFKGSLSWNEDLVRNPAILAGRPVRVTVLRGVEELRCEVPARVRTGGDPIYYYLALVGFFILASAALASMKSARSGLTWRYFAFAAAVFAVLALSDTPAASGIDWVLFLADRLGRLSFGPLFVLLALALARSAGGPRWRGAMLLAPPAALGALGVGIYIGAARGILRDPLALWQMKDRIELFMAALFLMLGLAVLARGASRENASYRRYVLRWAFWGSLAGFLPMVVITLLPAAFGADPPWWADLSALSLVVLPLALSSALFRLRPGDIEVYLKRAIGSLSVLFLTLAVFGAVTVLIDRIGGERLNLSEWVTTAVAALIAAVLYPNIRAVTRYAIDRLVYGGRYSFRRTLVSFGRELNSELNLEMLVAKFQDRIRETLDLAPSFVLVRFDREGVLRPVREGEPSVPIGSSLVERIRGVSYLLLEDLAHAPGAGRIEVLRGRGVQYLFPMKVEGEVRAVLATGGRRGGELLNSEDVELLVALCGHAAIALESARLFAALQEKIEEVERLRSYNEDILESSRVGILVVDREGAIQALNQALLDIYGAEREQALGRMLAEVFPLPLVRRIEKPTDESEGADGIRRLYRQSLTDRRGRRIVANISVSRLGGGQGGRVIVFDDVTDQVRMEEQLLRQDRLASIGLLASGVAHEVNTPLTGISSYAQMLLDEMDPQDPRAEILKKIERQTFRAAGIVHNLLNFTRDGGGGVELIRVRDIIDESLALFEPQLRDGKIRVEVHVEEGLPLLPGHRGKLQQVLLNLLLNARDAIVETGTIRIEALRRGGRLSLVVSDDGEGIAEEDLGKIFDPFFTTKPRGRGTGLGLSLSYTIIQEHKGEMTVESRRGEGTVFVIDLPLGSLGAINA